MKVLLFFCILYSFLLTVYCDHQQWEEKRYRQVNENYNRRPEMEDYNRRQEFEDNQNRQKVEEDMRRQEWEEKRLRKEWEEYKGQMGKNKILTLNFFVLSIENTFDFFKDIVWASIYLTPTVIPLNSSSNASRRILVKSKNTIDSTNWVITRTKRD